MEHGLHGSRRIVAVLPLVVMVLGPRSAQGQAQADPVTAEYDGFVLWRNSSTDNDGTAVETVRTSVSKGRVECEVIYTSPGHSAKAAGPGLLQISTGLTADPPATGKAYSFRIACPDAEYSNGIRAANWSHAMESYQQPGGEVQLDQKTNKFIPPAALKGSWTEAYDGGTSKTTLSWSFCRGCTPPPPPPLPAP